MHLNKGRPHPPLDLSTLLGAKMENNTEQRKSHEHLPQQERRVRFADQTDERDLSPRADVFRGNSMSKRLLPSPTVSDDIDVSSGSSGGGGGSGGITVLQADLPASLEKPQTKPKHSAVATVDPLHDPTSKPSLEIVPYIAQRRVHLPDPRLSTLLPKEYNNSSPIFDRQVLRASALPHRVLVRDSCDLPRGVRFEESGTSQLGPVLPKANIGEGQEEQRSKWMIVSAEQVEQTAKKLREQAEKNKGLEATVQSNKRERVLIYDAAMKQAEKRKEEGVNEVKHKFEREQGEMRREIDRELGKISALYQERCRDYATMVSDECDDETSEAAADLRRDWKRQKKTIDQLVRSDGEEDRQVSMIARAVMEQLQEETKDEMAARRADIYSDVKMEFESREVALRAALESDFQADLDGQLLLAEIRHQKEMEQLRVELGGGKAPSAEAATGAIIVYNAATPRRKEKGGCKFGAPSSVGPPSLSRRPRQQKMDVGMAAAEHSSDADCVGGVATPGEKQPGLGRKFPVFKPPVQKVSPDIGSKKAERPEDGPANKPTSMPRMRTKKSIRTAKATSQDDELKTTPVRKQERELDGSITNALMVSPTKAIPGLVTPSIDSDQVGSSGKELSRPNKRAKRLFSTACP